MSSKIIVGIDEVGRGAWAGPLVVGAVGLTHPIEGVKDSKSLSKTKRASLALTINQDATFVGLGWVSPREIDKLGLSQAMRLGCKRAIKRLDDYISIIIDGNINYLSENVKAKNLIKADQSQPAVSAASIVAKVARDEFMAEQAKTYRKYSFESNVGYGTNQHIEALSRWGVSPLHRVSFKSVQAVLS